MSNSSKIQRALEEKGFTFEGADYAKSAGWRVRIAEVPEEIAGPNVNQVIEQIAWIPKFARPDPADPEPPEKYRINFDDISVPAPHDPRMYKVQVKRDFYLFDQVILGHTGDKALKIYQLKAAAPLIYLQRDKLRKHLAEWMEEEGCYTPDEIDRWSWPVYEWPEVKLTPEQEDVLWEWRRKYKINDRTDWSQGVVLTKEEKIKLDKWRQVGILQPRQSGKSEVVVRVNVYVCVIIHFFRAAVFAPTEDQAKDFIFARTRDYTEGNPLFKGRFKTLNALDLEFNGPDHPNRGSGSSFAAGSASPGANIEGDTLDWVIIDESQDVTDYKIKKSIKYMLSARNGVMIKIGTVNTIKGHFHTSMTKAGAPFWHQVIIYPDIVAATRPDWAEFMERAIQEDGRWSDTVRMSIFLEWLLEVGMFCSEEAWESMLDIDLDFVEFDKKGLQFCLIDVAKSKDETVAMVIKVDPKRVIEGRHPFRVLNIMTMHGVDYASQFHQIKAWLDENYNVAAVGVDDTGGRGGIADQFLHTTYRVEAFTYSRPTKSEWYTNLQTIINANLTAMKEGRYHDLIVQIPGSHAAKERKIYRDFEQQVQELQKQYKNNYLVVHHPDTEGAKDDYGDVFMMAAWMASRVSVAIEDVEKAVEEIASTVAQDVDWNQDLFGSGSKNGPKKKKAAAPGTKAQNDLAALLAAAEDLDSPSWD